MTPSALMRKARSEVGDDLEKQIMWLATYGSLANRAMSSGFSRLALFPGSNIYAESIKDTAILSAQEEEKEGDKVQ